MPPTRARLFGGGSGSAPPYRRCGRRPWYAYGASPRQYVMPDDLVAQRRALGPRASADLEFYWQNWCGRSTEWPADGSVRPLLPFMSAVRDP
jgi:hypothetical protein